MFTATCFLNFDNTSWWAKTSPIYLGFGCLRSYAWSLTNPNICSGVNWLSMDFSRWAYFPAGEGKPFYCEEVSELIELKQIFLQSDLKWPQVRLEKRSVAKEC